MRAYDHEQDEEEQEDPNQQEEPEAHQEEDHSALHQLEEEYTMAKLANELHEALYQLKAQDSSLRKLQREVEGKVGEAQLTETIALINAGVHSDPNIIKLLKSREESLPEGTEDGKLRMNAGLFSRKLNQLSEGLSMLLGGQKRLESRITGVEGELTMQLGEKTGALQLQVEEVRGESSKSAMEVAQRVELATFDLGDRMRELETKLNWRLNDFKARIDEKINEELVLTYLQNTEKRVEKGMRDFQLASNIDPARVDALEQRLSANRADADAQITHCNYQLRALRAEMETTLVRREDYTASRAAVEQRLALFNDNFTDVYRRVLRCEAQEDGMQAHIRQLLADAAYSLQELKRINTVLLNIKISDDFQRMLEEMNPAKVLELQDAVDSVKSEQTNIFREIALAKREIAIVQAKSENMGFMTPNRERERFRKEEIEQALANFLVDNQFAQKIANLDKQLGEYKHSVDSVALLSRQVARLQKENDTHRLSLELRTLEQFVRRELALVGSRLRDKYSSVPVPVAQQRSGSNGSFVEDPLPVGEAGLGRSFSMRKVSAVSLTRQGQQGGKQLLEIKTGRR